VDREQYCLMFASECYNFQMK